MSLDNRWMGSELSVIEREILFNKKYSNVGFVKYDTNKGDYFFLNPSPFLKNTKKEIYHITSSPPPEYQCVEVEIIDEKTVVLDKFGEKWIKVREVKNWKSFDQNILACKRKIMDFREIIEFFTYPFKGESDEVEEIAGCSSLFAFSSPPMQEEIGGVKSAVFGKPFQWNLFQKPLKIIPTELRKPSSDFYYYISKVEKNFKKSKGELNLAIYKPENLLSDIPIVILEESDKQLSKENLELFEVESKIITAHLLDALLLQPQISTKIEELMFNKIYGLREEYISAGLLPFNQNIGDAIPKLAASYSRLKSSVEIHKEDVNYVVDLWGSMRTRSQRIDSSSLMKSHMLELTGDSRSVYAKLYDIYGADQRISMNEALKLISIDPVDFESAVDSLINKGYCMRKNNFITLLEPYKGK